MVVETYSDEQAKEILINDAKKINQTLQLVNLLQKIFLQLI